MLVMGTDVNHATIGNVVLCRYDDELIPEFRTRAMETAAELGAQILVFEVFDNLMWVDDLPDDETNEEN